MSGTRHESENALFAYSEGALAESEKARVEAHLSECSACTSIVREFRVLGAAIAATTPATDPSRLRSIVAQATRPVSHATASPSPRFTFLRKDTKMSAESVSSSYAKTNFASRNGMRWQWVTVLVAAIVLGGASGMWITSGKKKATTDTAWEHYQKAVLAYPKKDMVTVINELRKAEKGTLVVQTLEKGGSRQYATLRDLARKNADYAMSLAKTGQKDEALDMTEFNLSMADQLCQDGRLINGLVAVAIYQLTGTTRIDVYRVAGTAQETQDEQRRFQVRQTAFEQQVKPKIDTFIQNNSTMGAAEVASQEKSLVGEIVNAWRLSAPE